MIELPEWDSEFVAKSKRYTRYMNAYRTGCTLFVFLVPWGQAVVFGTIFSQRHLLTIGVFFCVLGILLVSEQALWAIKRRNGRRMCFRLLATLPELGLLCGSCMLWLLLSPGNLALAIGVWWVTGFLLALIRYVARRWALKEAVLQTKNYKLFGRRVGRFSKRSKHDKASLYQLADKSAFARYSVMTLVSDKPEIYASVEARRLLDPDQFRVVVAHELGHSWSTHYVSYSVANWIRRMLLVPLLVSAAMAILAGATASDQFQIFLFLTVMILIWQINSWAAMLLGRPRELGADLYGVEVTRTPAAFVEAMTKLAKVEPYNAFPNLFDTLALCSHPCTVKRLKRVATALSQSNERPGS